MRTNSRYTARAAALAARANRTYGQHWQYYGARNALHCAYLYAHHTH